MVEAHKWGSYVDDEAICIDIKDEKGEKSQHIR